jgi:uncharacterized membrane protein HdeD (DUF308 family)
MSYHVTETTSGDSLREHWGWLLALGIVFVLGGITSLLSPVMTTYVLTVFIAAGLLVSGAVQIFQAFRMRDWSGFFMALAVGILLFIAGLAIWLQPLISALALTLIVAAVFLAKGVAQIMIAFRLRHYPVWGWILASGIISLLVGLIIALGWPVSGLIALGIMVGISLLTTGWGYVMLAFAVRKA